MPSVGFEPTIPAGERPQTYALDRAATATGIKKFGAFRNWYQLWSKKKKKVNNQCYRLDELSPVILKKWVC